MIKITFLRFTLNNKLPITIRSKRFNSADIFHCHKTSCRNENILRATNTKSHFYNDIVIRIKKLQQSGSSLGGETPKKGIS